MQNIKIAICDDAPFICKHIQSFIEKNFECCEIIACFSDGEGLLDYISRKPVDLIITDIRMKHKSGLEVAEYIYTNNLPIKVIIISAFNEFQYAKKAIDYQVDNFICKPINPQELKKSIDKAILSIRRNQNKAIEQSYQLLDIYERNFTYLKSMLFKYELPDNISHNNIHYSLLSSENPFSFVFFVYENNYIINENNFKDLTAYSSDEFDVYPVYSINGESCIAVLFNDTSNAKFEQYIENMINGLKILYDIDAAYINFSIESFSDVSKVLSLESTKNLFEALCSNHSDIDLCREVALKDSSLQTIRVLTLLCMIFAVNRFKMHGALNYLKDLMSFDSINSIKKITNKIIDYCKNNKYVEGDIKVEVENYIQVHLSDNDLGLVKVATQFHYSPEYFSRWFKKTFLVNFHQYITSARMIKSVNLLNSGLAVKEIWSMLGFNSPAQFAKTFKKTYNCTPKEFIRTQKGE